jgi:hypothetical protein
MKHKHKMVRTHTVDKEVNVNVFLTSAIDGGK